MRSSIGLCFCLACVAMFAVSSVPCMADPMHGIAMHGKPKYNADFAHFDYANPNAPKGGVLRRGVIGSFDSLNPYIIMGQPAPGVREYVHESLLGRAYDEPFSLYGLLAESVDTTGDRREVTFQIRSEARFSDGAPVTPDDVLFSLQVLREKGRPFHRSSYSKVASAEKIGEHGVRFVFTSAGDREMPLIMGLMPILQRASTSPASFDKTSFDKMIGSGPYIIETSKPGVSLTYKRNPNYWGDRLPFNRGQNNFDSISFEFYRETTSLTEAFRKGLIDILGDDAPIDANQWAEPYDFPAAQRGEVAKQEFDIQVPSGMTALAFNTRRPLFNDIRVREAFTVIFDFEWMNKTLFHGLYSRTESFFDRSELASTGRPADDKERMLLSPFESGLLPGIVDGTFRQPQTDASGTNREGRRRAIALLREAGYEVRDGVMVKTATGEPVALEMMCLKRDQERLLLAYARSLAQIGITARVRLVDSAQYQRRLTSFDFDMVPASWASSLSPGNEQNFRWSRQAAGEDGSFNYPGVSSEGVDAAIAAMLTATERTNFVSAVRSLDRLLLSGRYVIPLYHPKTQWIAAWSRLAHPARSTLYGIRLETWWDNRIARASAE